MARSLLSVTVACTRALVAAGRWLRTDMWVAQMPSMRCDAESDEAPRCRVCFEPGTFEDQKEVTLHLGPRNCQLCFNAAYRSLELGHADIPYHATKTDCGLMLQDGELIEPCACKGTQRYVHKSCLVRWQATFFSIRRSPPFCFFFHPPLAPVLLFSRVPKCVCVCVCVGDWVCVSADVVTQPWSRPSFSSLPPSPSSFSLPSLSLSPPPSPLCPSVSLSLSVCLSPASHTSAAKQPKSIYMQRVHRTLLHLPTARGSW
jgi:hypothetical protein